MVKYAHERYKRAVLKSLKNYLRVLLPRVKADFVKQTDGVWQWKTPFFRYQVLRREGSYIACVNSVYCAKDRYEDPKDAMRYCEEHFRMRLKVVFEKNIDYGHKVEL